MDKDEKIIQLTNENLQLRKEINENNQWFARTSAYVNQLRQENERLKEELYGDQCRNDE